MIRSHRYYLFLFFAFALVHAVYWSQGIRFEPEKFPRFHQVLDMELLRGNLLEGLFYLHSQPPGFNLFLGLIVKAFPVSYITALHVCYVLLGMGMIFMLFALMRRLGVSERLAFGITFGFLLSPSFVLYEHFLFYTFPVAALLILAALLLHESLSSRRLVPLAAFFLVLTGIALTRSVYHLLYLGLVTVALLLLAPSLRRNVLIASAPALSIIFALYLKNFILFGVFGPSSWLGMNLYNKITAEIAAETVSDLQRKGELSALSQGGAFGSLEHYKGIDQSAAPYSHIKAVSSPRKSYGMGGNFNHLAYIAIAKEQGKDAVRLMKLAPMATMRSMVRAWHIYFKSSAEYGLLEPNLLKIESWINFFDRMFYGKWVIEQKAEGVFQIYFLLLLGIPLVLGLAFRVCLTASNQDHRVVLLFCIATVIYTAVVSNSLETGENNRFRFETDPLMLILLAVSLKNVLAKSTLRPRVEHSAFD